MKSDNFEAIPKQKEFSGKFLTHVKAEDLDEEGRFIAKDKFLVIGSNAFKDVRDKLTYVKIDGVIIIAEEAFANCGKLKKADIGFELNYRYPQNYDAYMFWKDKVIDTEEDYENALANFSQKYGEYNVHIKDGAFKNCVNLQEFHFPARVAVHGSPFRRCSNLTEISIDGSMNLKINQSILDRLEEYERPFRSVTFKDCNNVQKINIGKGVKMNINDLAQFYNLKEINLDCDFFERREFWRNAISTYPQFFLLLPTALFRDKAFVKSCLYDAPETFERVYGRFVGRVVFGKLKKEKLRIEKTKAKEKAKNLKMQSLDNGGGTSRTR